MSILPSLSLLNKINNFIQAQGGKFSLNYGLFLLGWKAGLRVSEAVSFDYSLKHLRHKDLYLVHGKGNKNRYVYVPPAVISELKTNNWKPSQTNRINFYNFLGKVKEKLNIPTNVELTPHTLRRCFTTHNALSGIPLPILQKSLGHANIRTTSFYWKGSVDIREFEEWLKPDADPKEPDEVPKVKVGDNPQLPKIPPIPPKLEKPIPNNTQELELLKTIAKLKAELEQKDLIITKKNKQLQNKDSEISLLTGEKLKKDQQLISLTAENEKLKALNHQKDLQLVKYKKRLENLRSNFNKSWQKLKQIAKENNLLLQNYTHLKNTAKSISKDQVNNNQSVEKPQPLEVIPKNNKFSLNTLSKAKKPPNNSLAVKEKDQTELVAEIQVWKPPN